MCEKTSAEVFAFSYNCDLRKKIKVLQTGIKLYDLVMLMIISSLKEISQ